MTKKISEEDKIWFSERIYTSGTGRIIVPTYLLNKYRKLTEDYKNPNEIIKSRLINDCYGML